MSKARYALLYQGLQGRVCAPCERLVRLRLHKDRLRRVYLHDDDRCACFRCRLETFKPAERRCRRVCPARLMKWDSPK